MTEPVRMRLSRAAGFNLQRASLALNGLPAVHVGRPGRAGNPFEVGVHGTREACVEFHVLLLGGWLHCTGPSFEVQRAHRRFVLKNLDAWRGHNIACWCGLDGKPCHGNTIRVLANAPSLPVSITELLPWRVNWAAHWAAKVHARDPAASSAPDRVG